MADRRRCKVDRALEKYDLDTVITRYDTVDEYLLARWKGTDGREGEGYRPLTDWFNERLLKYVYDEAGRESLGTRLESEYAALTGDDDLLREEVADDLRADGIAADEILDDMVSWSTMRHHLKGCLDGEKARAASSSDWERESIRIARRMTLEKVHDALRSLDSKGKLPGGVDAETVVQIQVQCPHCHVRVPLDEALDRGYVCEAHLSGGTTPETE